MIKHLLRKASSFSFVALISVGLMGVLLTCSAAAQKKSTPKAAPARSAPSHAAAPRGGTPGRSTGARGGASASHGPTANGAHGPSA
ncbi:MAG: hypothetical protein WBY53_04510, partial [Acidobacteriaceae bacterium]